MYTHSVPVEPEKQYYLHINSWQGYILFHPEKREENGMIFLLSRKTGKIPKNGISDSFAVDIGWVQDSIAANFFSGT